MNYDIVEDLEYNIKFWQTYNKDCENFNCWYVFRVSKKYCQCYLCNWTIDNIKKVIELYGSSCLTCTYIFSNIEIVKFCIEFFRHDDFLKLPSEVIHGACYNFECIKLLFDTYGNKLPITEINTTNHDSITLILENFDIKFDEYEL